VPLCSVGECIDLLDRQKLVIGKLEVMLVVNFSDRFQAERLIVERFCFFQIARFENHMAQGDLTERCAGHTNFEIIVVEIDEAKRANNRGALAVLAHLRACNAGFFDALHCRGEMVSRV